MTQTSQNKNPKHIKCILRIIFFEFLHDCTKNHQTIWICGNSWTHEINHFIFLRALKITTTILRTNIHSIHLFVYLFSGISFLDSPYPIYTLTHFKRRPVNIYMKSYNTKRKHLHPPDSMDARFTRFLYKNNRHKSMHL